MIDHRRWEPISAVTAASLATMFDIADAAIDAVRIPLSEYRKMNGPAVPKMSISRSDSAVEGCCTSDAELPVTTELKLIEAMEEESVTVLGSATKGCSYQPTVSVAPVCEKAQKRFRVS